MEFNAVSLRPINIKTSLPYSIITGLLLGVNIDMNVYGPSQEEWHNGRGLLDRSCLHSVTAGAENMCAQWVLHQGRKWESWKDAVTRFLDNILVSCLCLVCLSDNEAGKCNTFLYCICTFFYFWTMQHNQ